MKDSDVKANRFITHKLTVLKALHITGEHWGLQEIQLIIVVRYIIYGVGDIGGKGGSGLALLNPACEGVGLLGGVETGIGNGRGARAVGGAGSVFERIGRSAFWLFGVGRIRLSRFVFI